MPRRTKEEAEQTRRHILDVALHVFAEKGYSATSLQQIAQKAGYTRGAVYWHFNNKADLFMALAADVEGDGFKGFHGVEHINSRDDLRDVLCAFLGRQETDPRVGAFTQVIWFGTEWAEDLLPLLASIQVDQRNTVSWMVKALGRLRERGQIPPAVDPEREGRGLFVFFSGLLTVGLINPDFLSFTDDVPQYIDRFLDWLVASTEDS